MSYCNLWVAPVTVIPELLIRTMYTHTRLYKLFTSGTIGVILCLLHKRALSVDELKASGKESRLEPHRGLFLLQTKVNAEL